MAQSYDPTLATDRDWVRFVIGDDRAPFSLHNEEIDAVLSLEPNKFYAAARCGEHIMGKGRDAVSKSVGNLSISYGSNDSPESAYRSKLSKLRTEGAAAVFGRTKSKVLRVL